MPGNESRPAGGYRISAACVTLVREAERLAQQYPVDARRLQRLVARGRAARRPSRCATRGEGPAVELVVEPTASRTAENAARTLPLLRRAGDRPAPSSSARRCTCSARASSSRGSTARSGSRRRFRVPRLPPSPRAVAWELVALPAAAAAPARRARPSLTSKGKRVSDTVVFIPAWNEEENLPGCSTACRPSCPTWTSLVVDDGSTDRTAEVAREHGAEVLSLGTNQGLPVGIAAGYRWALEHEYAYCGRVDADGQHPPEELARLLELVRERRVRRRRRLALRLRRRLRALPLQARPGAALRHGGAAARDGAASSGGRSATRRAASTR